MGAAMMVSCRSTPSTPAFLPLPMGPNLATEVPEVANSGASAPADSPWRRSWYPVAYLVDLDRTRPKAFTLLGDDLVLWWDGAAQQWRAFADVCPHRLVPLSEGRLNGAGELECPYHGWTFRGDGACTAIPQASQEGGGEDREAPRLRSPRSHCRTYATATVQGLLFVYAGDSSESADRPLPLVPQLEEPLGPGERAWAVQDTFRDLPYDALTLLENVLDVSHVPFTHHGTVGRRENAGPVELELLHADAGGFSGLWEEGPRRGKLGRQHTRFMAPCLMWHDLTAPKFARILTVVYVTPIRPGFCRIFARFPFQFRSPLPPLLLRLRPIWLQHLANHVVLEDDQLFLHWQERVLAQRGGSAKLTRSCYLASQADRYVLALHQWVVEHGGPPFPGEPLPPRQNRILLMERNHSHTDHCRACSGALSNLRRWRPWLGVVPWLGVLAVAWWHTTAVLLLAIGTSLLAWRMGHQFRVWEGLLEQGSGQPPRNRG